MIPTIIRLSVCGFRSSEFVPVLPSESKAEGLVWMNRNTVWGGYVERKAVAECLHYRDADGVEYEKFDNLETVFVFNRVFPGSLQTFTPEGVEKDASKCEVCGAMPAAEMYQGPNLCARCFEVVRERMKAEKELAMGGMLVLTADKAREMCRGTKPRTEGAPDLIADLPRTLALADRMSPKTAPVVGVLDRMEAGELTPDEAVAALMEDAAGAIRVNTNSVTPRDAVERWFKECADAFGYPSVHAMPHGVLYRGNGEKVVTSFDHLLTPEAEKLVLDADAAQESVNGEDPAGFAPLSASVSVLPRVNVLPPSQFERGKFRTIRLPQGEVVVGDPKPIKPSPTADLWRKFYEMVKDKDGEAVEEALSLRMEGDPSGLGKEADVLLAQIESFGEALPENADEARARLIIEKWVIQKVIFPVGKYTVDAAQKWMREHDYPVLKTTTKDRYIHVRSRPPKKGAGAGDYGFIPMGDTGVKVLRMRVAESVRVYDDPADYDRVLREAGLHELAKGADKVAPLGPRSWVLGYPDGSSRLLLYFPRKGIARLYEKEFAVFSFDPNTLDDPDYNLGRYKAQHGKDEVPWNVRMLHAEMKSKKAGESLLNELIRVKRTNADLWGRLFACSTSSEFERVWREGLRGGRRGPKKTNQEGGTSHDSWVSFGGTDFPMDLILTTKEDHDDLRKKIARVRPDLDRLETSDLLLILTKGDKNRQGRFDVCVITPGSVVISPAEQGGTRRGTAKTLTRWAYGNVKRMRWVGMLPEAKQTEPGRPIFDLRPIVATDNLSEQASKGKEEENPFKGLTKAEILHYPKRGTPIPDGYWGWRLPSGAFIAVNMYNQLYRSDVQSIPYERLMRWIFVQGINSGAVTGGIPRDNDATFKRGSVFFSAAGSIASVKGTSPNFDAIYATIKALPIQRNTTLEIDIVDKGLTFTGIPTGFDEWVWKNFPSLKPAHIPSEKSREETEPEVEVKVPPEPRPIKSTVYSGEEYDPFRKPPTSPIKKIMGQGLSFDIGHGRGEYREIIWREVWHKGKTADKGPEVVDAFGYKSEDGVYSVHAIWNVYKDNKRPEQSSPADYTLQAWKNQYHPFLEKEGYVLAIEEHPTLRDVKGQFKKIIARPAGEGIRPEELPRGSYGVRWVGPVKGQRGFWAGTIKKAPDGDLLGKTLVLRWGDYSEIRRPQVGKEYDFHVIHMPAGGFVQTHIFTESLLSEALAPEEETLDDTFDNIVRKLSITGSIDALQDVEFDDTDGSIFLFFSATMPREEADELTQILSRYYVNTRLVGSPDHSLPDEEGEAEWWVIHVPSRKTPAPSPEAPKGKTPPTTPQGNAQFTGKDAIGAIVKGLDVDKAVDKLVKAEGVEILASGTISLAECGIEEIQARPLNPEHPDWKGGVITFSTDVNATAQPGVIGKLKSWLSTVWNRLNLTGRLRSIMASIGKDFGYTVRPMGRGNYVSPDGTVFNERSLSIEILGVPNEFLQAVGAAITKAFNQQEVLVRYYDTNTADFVKENDPRFADLIEGEWTVEEDADLTGYRKVQEAMSDNLKIGMEKAVIKGKIRHRFVKESVGGQTTWALYIHNDDYDKYRTVLFRARSQYLSRHESADSLQVVEFNPATFAQAFANHVGGELVMAPRGLSSGIVEVVVGDRRIRFTAPGLGGGVNVAVLHRERGIHSLGHFAAPDVGTLVAKIEENSGPFGPSPT